MRKSPAGEASLPVQGVAIVTVWRFVGIACSAAQLALVARALVPEAFGPLVAWSGAISVLIALADGGLSTLTIRALTREADYGTYQAAARLKAFAGGASVLIAITVFPASSILGIDGRSAAAFMMYVAVRLWVDARQTLLVVAHQTSLVAVVQAAERLVAFGATAVLLNEWPEQSLPTGMAIGALVSFVLIFGMTRAHTARRVVLQHRTASQVLRRSAPFLVAALAAQLQNLDTFLVAAVAGAKQSAYYGAPSRLTSPILVIVAAYAFVMFPRFSADKNWSTVRAKALRGVKGLVGLSLLPALVGILAAKRLVVLIFGGSYDQSAWPLRLIICAMLIVMVNMPLASALQAFGRERAVSRAIAFGTAIGLATGSAGAALAGATGGAVGLVAAQLTVLAGILRVWFLHDAAELSASDECPVPPTERAS